MTKEKEKTCLGCSDHETILDPDPHDWFCDDDSAVVCKITPNPNIKPTSEYVADRQEFRVVACSCRPYNLKKEATIPEWCPKKKKRSGTVKRKKKTK